MQCHFRWIGFHWNTPYTSTGRRRPAGCLHRHQAPRERLNGVDYITGDVRDLSQLNVTGKVDRIYNLAAIHTTPGHPAHEYYETNVLGATEITAWARRNNICEIVFTSSIWFMALLEEAKSESTKPTPESAYGWSKFLERIQKNWMEEDSSRKLVICRPAVIFGHGEGGNFTRMAKLLKKGSLSIRAVKTRLKPAFMWATCWKPSNMLRVITSALPC
jgi:nucleoside-diphosphate-sugar epimerase